MTNSIDFNLILQCLWKLRIILGNFECILFSGIPGFRITPFRDNQISPFRVFLFSGFREIGISGDREKGFSGFLVFGLFFLEEDVSLTEQSVGTLLLYFPSICRRDLA